VRRKRRNVVSGRCRVMPGRAARCRQMPPGAGTQRAAGRGDGRHDLPRAGG
jgi:hypothetical protein